MVLHVPYMIIQKVMPEDWLSLKPNQSLQTEKIIRTSQKSSLKKNFRFSAGCLTDSEDLSKMITNLPNQKHPKQTLTRSCAAAAISLTSLKTEMPLCSEKMQVSPAESFMTSTTDSALTIPLQKWAENLLSAGLRTTLQSTISNIRLIFLMKARMSEVSKESQQHPALESFTES